MALRKRLCISRMSPYDLARLADLLRLLDSCYENNGTADLLLDAVFNELSFQLGRTVSSNDIVPLLSNPRHAGRKATIGLDVRAQVKQLRAQGRTLQEIAAHLKISYGSVHKIVNS